MVSRSWLLALKMVCLGMAGVWIAGCGEENPATPTCAAEDMIGGVCAGIPVADVCGADTCTEGVMCAEVRSATNNAELTSALMGASAGTCISLAPGSYSAVNLPGGVSLLGRSATDVNVAGVVIGAGNGAVVRGLSVGGGGVRVMAGAMGTRLESLRISGDNDGIAFDPGSSGSIVTSEIAGSGRVGIFAQDADITVEGSVVRGASERGISFAGTSCDAACTCTSRPKLVMKGSVIRDNHLLGVAAYGADLEIDGVDVKGTLVGTGANVGLHGGGVTAAQCSKVASKNFRVLDSAAWGVLVDHSTGTLGAEGEGVEIRNNLPGLWIQNVKCTPDTPDGPCLMLHDGLLEDNCAVGIGVAGQSQGIILCKSVVAGTKTYTVPVSDVNQVGASKEVGDGVDWLDESEVTIDRLTLRGNERQSMLIDGPTSGAMGGKIWSMTLEGGDENKPPLQQNLPSGGKQPELNMGVTLATNVARQFAVPQPLGVPAGM